MRLSIKHSTRYRPEAVNDRAASLLEAPSKPRGSWPTRCAT